ncbi:MAG TPA: S-methyl-5-thioribose-1-phosphate isomerase [Gemmatimonadetes bacterium]|nr:S-methyl-5-thioribose-1-phosphate isomerase [Gemmatimonadota bacterium]
MNVGGEAYRTIWLAEDRRTVEIIDQTRLPHEFVTLALRDVNDAVQAIRSMQVRGAPLIGVTAAYGVCLALTADGSDGALEVACDALFGSRPTAVNLSWALQTMRKALAEVPPSDRVTVAYETAAKIADEDVASCRAIGEHGAELFADLIRNKEREGGTEPLNILTHCNAGWLATVDYGTALAPVYTAHDAGLAVHVWVDETRPRNQGAALTAWELGQHGVPHTVIADNAGGHLMQHGRVDVCVTGSDRTTGTGDVCNKIGTYLKALAAHDNGLPFYVALPHSTIDWSISDGIADIPIEERDEREVTHVSGLGEDGAVITVRVTPRGSPAANAAFDVTPARLVTGLITERGVAPASAEGLAGLYPERAE